MISVQYNPKLNSFAYCRNGKASILPNLVWHITDRCLLKCPFCYSTKTNKDTPFSKSNDYINIFNKLGVQKIDISGGEPLLYNDLDQLIFSLKKIGIHVTITTSGLGSLKLINWLSSNWFIFSRVIISIDAPDFRDHSFLRGNSILTKHLSKLITLLTKNKCNNLRINTITTPILLKNGNVKKFIDLINQIKPKEWCLIQPHPANKKKDFKNYYLDQTTFEKIQNDILKSNTLKTKILNRNNNHYSTYWVLYPNGYLCKHSNSSRDQIKHLFNIEELNNIKKSVENNQLWLPT